MNPIQDPQKNEKQAPEAGLDSPILVRQPDDTLVVFGPDLDDFNGCDDPC